MTTLTREKYVFYTQCPQCSGRIITDDIEKKNVYCTTCGELLAAPIWVDGRRKERTNTKPTSYGMVAPFHGWHSTTGWRGIPHSDRVFLGIG